ncbi:LD-carboxypeptidase LdcB, LAS superfamily [Thalassobacillus cyri]|uniref:LD-carboxypeptidase LdcB, LAS superfamily n=1 Tax=Thalassobacillus cyri TaxID=571932 RepID=A0A1H3Z268_9BACI|nr:D-alanyl-D-alanine carboxypeptidase family protein [Thalassobacillus cyri]SEA17943.1 LD-carboxypeptidase LdcB, LAS superfamily [Thalassobacillus cyri]
MPIMPTKKIVYLLAAFIFPLFLTWPATSSAHDKNDIMLANKQHSLSADYVPNELVTPDVAFSGEEERLQPKAATALESMFKAAEKDGVQLYAASGYRSYEYQKNLFQFWVSQYGEEQANRISAKPGESEHQTGLTMDITSEDVDFKLKQSFGDTAAGQWIEMYAAEYGFIIRYQENKEPVTGYDYEPWHLRYVGKDHSKTITNFNITLETYLSHDMDSMPNTYTVQAGDTVYSIAKNNGTTVEYVLALNPKINTRSLPVGSEIQLPGQEIHIVEKGDTISEVAAKYSGVTPGLLMDVNDHVDPNQLPIDAAINIP